MKYWCSGLVEVKDSKTEKMEPLYIWDSSIQERIEVRDVLGDWKRIILFGAKYRKTHTTCTKMKRCVRSKAGNQWYEWKEKR